MDALVCTDLVFGYTEQPTIRGLSLRVRQGETAALLGLSGSGKTTLLGLVAGFEPPAAGTIDINGDRVSGQGVWVPPEKRSVGMVFQHHALWPHLSVAETVAYPLRRAGQSRTDALSQAQALLRSVEIEHLADRPVDSLSGGQQQRVGLARALARRPALFLFDEPTAHLDTPLRATLETEVAAHRRDGGAAAIYATHNAGEALAVADQVSLIRDGRIIQTGSPDHVYEEPLDHPAALLTGPASLLEVTVADAEVKVGEAAAAIEGPLPAGGRVELLIRPEWATLGGPLSGVVADHSFRGAHTDYRIETDAGLVIARHPGPPIAAAGERCEWSLQRAWPLPGPLEEEPG